MKTIRSLLSTAPESSNETSSNVSTNEPSTAGQNQETKTNRSRKQERARIRSRGTERSRSNLQRGWQMIQKLSFPTQNEFQTSIPIEETLYPPPNSEKSSLISYFDPEPGNVHLPSKGTEPKLCRICHMTTETSRKKMVSPCRCTGTMKYVHSSCLSRWHQISASTHFFLPEPKCELCGYKYKTHPFYYVFRRPHLPYLNFTDLIMHILFFVLISIMIFCGAVAFRYLHLSLHRRHPRRDRIYLTKDEIAMITAAVFFLVSFIMALLTQYRADCTIFRAITRFWASNKLWIIRNYDPIEDKGIFTKSSATQTV